MSRKRKNRFTAEWQRVLEHELKNNMLLDTPMGKTVFAMGASFVMLQLNEHHKEWKEEWHRLYDEIKEFSEAYMSDSARIQAQRRIDQLKRQVIDGPPS